jgi:C4-dicarboxylate-specific signal transduction histidine kinase
MLWYDSIPYFTYDEKINIYEENNPWTLSLLHPIFNIYEFCLLSFWWILTCLMYYFYYLYTHNRKEKMLVLQKNKEQGDTIHGQQHLIENIFESLSYPFYVVSVDGNKLLMENLKARNTNWYQENKGSLIPTSDVVHARRALIQERKVDDRYFEIHAYPVFNDAGEIDKVIEYAHDVTERKFMEKEKDHMMKQLYQSTKLASIGELAAGVAHEINNPLAIIKGYVDLTQKTLFKGNYTNPIIEDSIKKIKDSVDRIAKIVLGLRTYARMDNEDEAKRIDVMQVINQSISLVDVVFKKCSVSLR